MRKAGNLGVDPTPKRPHWPRLPSIEARWRSGDVEDCKASPNHGKTAKVRSFTPLSTSPDINDLQDGCELSRPVLTGFARIENDMAMHYATRPSGWPVGREYRGAAWSCVTPTVQIVQQKGVKGAKRYVVLTLFPFLRTDRRHPPSSLMSLSTARGFAWRRLRELGAGAAASAGQGHGIELARCGDYIGLEVFR